MTLLQLKYIVKIVECGSMNEASHELYVSQPALSASVRELEKELGIEIFTRSSQGIALTVAGAEFLTYARQVLDRRRCSRNGTRTPSRASSCARWPRSITCSPWRRSWR